MEDVFLNNITNNSIYKNGLDGVFIKDAKSNRILNNNITKNGVSGLRLEGYTTRNIIMHNNISSNVVNIYANSLTNGDQITQNTLMFAKRAYGSYVEDDNVGAAIVFADNYQAAKQGNMLFSHNSIGANDVWDAKSTMSHPAVNIGANWYFDNDGNYAVGHICPMVFGRAITADELKTLSMGFGGDENGLFGQLYDGNNPQGAGAFTIDNVNVNGKDYGSIEVGEDGRFSLNDLDFDELPAGSVITITVGGHSFNVTINERIISNKTKTNDTAETAENDSYPDEENLPIKEGASPQGTKNGAGSGTGSLNGSGSGEGNFTGSGISVGTLSGQSNAGTGDSGENGGGSASEGLNAYEILKEENTPTTAKNSQLIAVFAVALVILIIALGYRSKNKDDYNDDGDYSL
jgi:parallel beta-helix repeat protein